MMVANVSCFPGRPWERSTKSKRLMRETAKTSDDAELMENSFVVPTEDIRSPMISNCRVVKRPGNHLLQSEFPGSGGRKVVRLPDLPSVSTRDGLPNPHESSTA